MDKQVSLLTDVEIIFDSITSDLEDMYPTIMMDNKMIIPGDDMDLVMDLDSDSIWFTSVKHVVKNNKEFQLITNMGTIEDIIAYVELLIRGELSIQNFIQTLS